MSYNFYYYLKKKNPSLWLVLFSVKAVKVVLFSKKIMREKKGKEKEPTFLLLFSWITKNSCPLFSRRTSLTRYMEVLKGRWPNSLENLGKLRIWGGTRSMEKYSQLPFWDFYKIIMVELCKEAQIFKNSTLGAPAQKPKFSAINKIS